MEASGAEPKRRKRWGEETDIGKKVVEDVVKEQGRLSESGVGSPTPDASAPNVQEENQPAKKRKSRWGDEPVLPGPPPLPPPLSAILPASLSHLIDFNPESIELNRQLNLVNQKLALLAAGQIPEEYVNEGQRSPSPEPLYNDEGVRINTRDQRIKDALHKQRNVLITQLIQRNPNYKPPADYRPEKKFRKLRIPQDEYPGYNFIGLIIGPRGNTQKRMEKESGARIVIRGKGSVKEGRLRGAPGGAMGLKGDSGDNEDLHVLVTADTDEQLEKACVMVQKLLEPSDESMQDHKRLQLRELASLNGTLRDSDGVDEGHVGSGELYTLPDELKARANAQYARDVAAVHGGTAAHEIESEYNSFMKELGGNVPRELLGDDDRSRSMRRGRRSPSPRPNGHHYHGHGRDPLSPQGPLPGPPARDEPDPCSVYVGYIAQHVEEGELAHLFSSFGQVMDCRIIRERSTGISKGFGFVRMANEHQAMMCVDRLNLYQLGGRRLSVRPRGNRGQGPQGPPGALPPPPPMSGYDPQGYSHVHSQQQSSHRLPEDELPPGVNQNEFYDSSEGCRAHMVHTQTAHDPSTRVDWDQIDREARRERLARLRPRTQHLSLSQLQPQGVQPSSIVDNAPPGADQGPMDTEGPGAQEAHQQQNDIGGLPNSHMQPTVELPPVEYTLKTEDMFLYGPLPEWDPPPPGLEQEAQDAALQAALLHDPLSLGYPPDPSQIMTSEEYAQYLSAAPTQGAGAGQADAGAGEGEGGGQQAGGKKKRVRNRKPAGGGAPGTGGDGEGSAAPVVVQLVELDPEAVERAKKRREEEEAARIKAAQEKEERLKEIERRRREELAELAASRVPLPPPPSLSQPAATRHAPKPSPPPTTSDPSHPHHRHTSRGVTRDRSSPPGRRSPSRSPMGRTRPTRGRRSISRSRSRSPGPFRGRGYSPPRSSPRGRGYSPGRPLPPPSGWGGGGRYSSSRSPLPAGARGGRVYSPGRGPPPGGRGRFSGSRSPPRRYSRSRSPGGGWRRRSPAGGHRQQLGRYGGSRSSSPAGRRGGVPGRDGPAGQFLAGGRSPSPAGRSGGGGGADRRRSPVPSIAQAPAAAKVEDEEGEEGEIEEGEVAVEALPPAPRGRDVGDSPPRGGDRDGGGWRRDAPGWRERGGLDRPVGQGWERDGEWRGGSGDRGGRRSYSGRHDRRGGERSAGGYGEEDVGGAYYDEYGVQPTTVQMQAAMMMAMMQGGMLGTYADNDGDYE